VETSITLRELNGLKSGDIIAVDLPDLVTLEAEDTPVFRGSFGMSNGSRAVKIQHKIIPDSMD
jgi:flagellar motor switch protein FliM